MKILMLAPQPFFEPRGTPFSVLGRLKVLSELGHQVDLVTYHLGQDVVIPQVAIYRSLNVPLIKSIKIGPSPLKILLDILLVFKAIQLLLRNRYDLLHTHEESGIFGIALAKMFRIRHLYDMHSSLPQQLSNFQSTAFRPIVRIFDWLERRTINASQAVITICPALENHVKQVNDQVAEVMIENVPTGIDPADISVEDMKKFRASYPQTKGRRVVLYAGTFEVYQGIDLLIGSAQQICSVRKDLLFLMVGGQPEQVAKYRRRVDDLGLSNYFVFTGNRPPEEIPMFVNLSHVLVSPRIDGTNTPLKIYSYLQSGKPIVATDLYTHTQVLNSDVSVLVEPTEEALAEGISAVLDDPQTAASLGAQARQLFEAKYSYRSYVQKTEQALRLAAGPVYGLVGGVGPEGK